MTLPPRLLVTADQALDLATAWGLPGASGANVTVTELDGERDSNWRVDVDGTPCGVLKVFHPDTPPELLAMRSRAMEAASAVGLPVPSAIEPAGNARLESVTLGGHTHTVRMVSWLNGRPLGSICPILPEHARALGSLVARVDQALAAVPSTELPARRDFAWNMLAADRTLRERLEGVADDAGRALLERILEDVEARILPALRAMDRQLIHNDANDWNVLVGTPAADARPELTGLIDFGDVVVAPRVVDLAVAATYVALDRDDPLTYLGACLAGYHSTWALTEEEVDLFMDLIRTRLAMSVSMSAWQRSREPENAYLSISEKPAWTLLYRLEAFHPRLLRYRMRAACGLEAVPGADKVASWIRRRHGACPAIVRPARPDVEPVIFDFSAASLSFGPVDLTVPGAAEEEIWRRTGDAVGIGRYNECRLAYTGVQFATESGERRTLHLGIDFFRPAGTAVHAPLDGRVHSVRVHRESFDYGGVVVLEHAPDDAPMFWTLYGHLSHASVLALEPGQKILAGEAFSELGAFDENGGWVAHLHFQVITDLLEFEGTFPGVAAPGQAAMWQSLCPDPSGLAGLNSASVAPEPPSVASLLARRAAVLGPNLSISYRTPLHFVRGIMQYLYDPKGRAWLDAVNNVPHVGHQNRHVVDMVAKQLRTMNSNTRYLHETILEFAERITATLPDGLDVAYVVNSGSEANDLALRIARTATGMSDVMVLDGAYHGHLTSLIDVSPYKFDGRGGRGKPLGTRVVPMPDAYRGPFRGMTPETGAAYARTVEDALANGPDGPGGVAAFIAESVPGCGGQIVPPPGYFRAAAAAVRAQGGVFIADEVQVGMGRAGSVFWGFELQNVVPDIVVIGKPVGNGHPLGVVVTTRALADAFANGMEYFNTFGGNPASCAAGLAVLDEIDARDLQTNALRVGKRLYDGLAALAHRHPVIGDVRGVGLFLGVELVRDRVSQEPAADEASYVVNRLAEKGVLLSTDGPLHNVLKIKPPLVFTEQNADYLVDTLDAVLAEDFVRLS